MNFKIGFWKSVLICEAFLKLLILFQHLSHCSSSNYTTTTQLNTQCGRDSRFYCPSGSKHQVVVGEGYYAIDPQFEDGKGYASQKECGPGTYCISGAQYLCPAGYYGAKFQEINPFCSGKCKDGYYCPVGSVLSTAIPCGDASVYCPEGSAYPIKVTPGYYTYGHSDLLGSTHSFQHSIGQLVCLPGTFCSGDGYSRLCPSGTYGNTSGLLNQDCSGPCQEGYYCPIASTSAKQIECGSSDKYCPAGSPYPLQVDIGYYSFPSNSTINNSESISYNTQSSQLQCEPGSYCVKGIKYPCPAGSYGDNSGLAHTSCSGVCPSGYYCPVQTVSYTEYPCGSADYYCPEGSILPTHVDRGYYTYNQLYVVADELIIKVGNVSTRSGQLIAPAGQYAYAGELFPCDAGHYGSSTGMSEPTCDGLCHAGYFCHFGSTSPTQYVCGDDALFCPVGSRQPTPVRSGYYTAQYQSPDSLCPPGQWRNMSKSLDPTLGQLSALPTQKIFPDCELCPDNTYKMVVGNELTQCRPCNDPYTTSSADRRTCICTRIVLEPYFVYYNLSTESCAILPRANQSADVINNVYSSALWGVNNAMTRYEEALCEPGFYCVNGTKFFCPAGRYGGISGMTNPLCSGTCSKGYYCPKGSSSRKAIICDQPSWFCPEGSGAPTVVAPGFFSTGDSSSPSTSPAPTVSPSLTQTPNFVPTPTVPTTSGGNVLQVYCPPGNYCPGDGLFHPCPVGRYSDRSFNMSSDQCVGPCRRGYYCTAGSSSATQHPCGNSSVYCKTGSFEPSLVHLGFYGIFTGTDAGTRTQFDTQNLTFSAEIPCEKGYYCTGGVKTPCPPGTYGGREGLFSSNCSGYCARGHYCPSYLEPFYFPHAPKTTIWPLHPHIRANDYKCGDVTQYCPSGAFFPITVTGGFYTMGGGKDNHTRYSQRICPPGSYCTGGIPYLCPRGRFGSTSGISLETCTGRCPAGFYCPPGTAQPIQCSERTYSTGDAYECQPCPGVIYDSTKNYTASCRDSRYCCI